jgi:hypothetical protein
VHIRKNKRETKKEMNDGILEVIKERLSNERTEERGLFSPQKSDTEEKKKCSKIHVFSVAFGVAYLV